MTGIKHIKYILAFLRLIYKHYKQGFLQNNRIYTINSKFWWLPRKHAYSLLIQHLIFVKQLEFVNISYTKASRIYGVTKSRKGEELGLLLLLIALTLVN